MYGELASVRGVVNLPPEVALDAAQGFLVRQGYTAVQRTDTTVTAQRRAANGTGEQELLNLTVAVDPQLRGGVRIKVRGNDQEGIREQRAVWTEWAESLPRKETEPHEADMQQVVETPDNSVRPSQQTIPAGPAPHHHLGPSGRSGVTWRRRLTLFVLSVLTIGALSLLFLIFGGIVGLVAGAITQSVTIGVIVGVLAGLGIVAYAWLKSIVMNEVIDIWVEDISRVWQRGRR